MNKSLVVHQLPLNHDVINHICSFIFYTYNESIFRNINKYNTMVNDLKQIIRVGSFQSNEFPCAFIYYYHPRMNNLIKNIIICNWCGNYITNENCTCD
jgi:hypothetical protein